MTISGTANQVTAVVSATDTLTLGLASNITVSGTTHALGTIAISGNTISSSDSATVTIDDNLSLSAGKTFTAGTITAGLLTIDETLGFPRISSTRGDDLLVLDAIPVLQGSSIIFEGATANTFETTISVTDPTADRTVTIPDATGTIILDGSTGYATSTIFSSAVTLVIYNSAGVAQKTIVGSAT